MKKMNHEESKLETILECSRIGTWEWNVQTGETLFNETWAKIVGYTLDELAPVSIKTWKSLVHPDDLEASGKLLERHFSGELPYYDFEGRMKHKDGHWVWVHDRGKVVSWCDDSKPMVMFGLHEDVTERKRAEEALRESEILSRSTLDGLSAHIAIINESGVIVAVNKAWREFAVKNSSVCGSVSEGANYLRVCDGAASEAPEAAEFARAIRSILCGSAENFAMEYACHSPNEQRWFIGWITRFPTTGINRVIIAHENITERKRAEEALRESNEIFNQFMINSPVHVYIKDEKLRLLNISDSFESLLGKPINELLGKDSYELLPPEVAESAIVDDQKTLTEGKTVKAEEILNGRVYSTIKFPIHREPGKPDYLGGFSVDITERRLSENVLRESEEKFSLAFQTSPYAITITRAKDGKFIEVNDAFMTLAGYTREEAYADSSIGLRVWLNSEDRDRVVNDLRAGRMVFGHVYPFRRKGDTTFMGSFSARIILLNGEQCILSSIEDITERKRAEDAIAAEKERLAVTLRSIGDGVITTGIDGTIVLMNKVAEELCGWKQNEAHGKPLSSVFNIINQSTREPHENPVMKVLSSGQIIELANHTLLISRDGTERMIADSGAPIKDKESKTIGVVLVFRDMTEKHKMLDNMLRIDKLDALGVLAGGIAHDFNNLMGGIFGYIDMAREATKEAKTTSYLSKAMNTIERARALTQQLLTFAKGGAPIQKIDHLFPFVEEVARFALSGANVSCNFDIPPDLWACNFDKNQIGQVIDNIIINAQQAMPVGGKIELSARNITLAENEHPLLKKGNYVKISITDTGIGIPKELLAKIFDPFFTTKAKGHGLGLATCYSIIKRHDGCIDVDSESGKGTTFNIYLPASTETVSSGKKKTDKTHKESGTFLIMDDEEVMQDTIGDMLGTLGYAAVCKDNGKDAIDFFISETKANRTFAGMIFDLTVPGGMGGKEAIGEIRKSNRDIPVFVASGYADDPVMKNPTEYGFMASICKPFRKSELSEMLNKYMRTKK